jgi:NAD-dependent SIR2 family protein deacetylase
LRHESTQLLEKAEKECQLISNNVDDDHESSEQTVDSEGIPTTTTASSSPKIPELPTHLTKGIQECTDCQTKDGRYLT